MRISLVILALVAIAVGMIDLRRARDQAHHQVHRLQLQQIRLRRLLQDQQETLSRLTAPGKVEQRVEQMDVRLTHRRSAPGALAQGLP